jgi:hypothetical protein
MYHLMYSGLILIGVVYSFTIFMGQTFFLGHYFLLFIAICTLNTNEIIYTLLF